MRENERNMSVVSMIIESRYQFPYIISTLIIEVKSKYWHNKSVRNTRNIYVVTSIQPTLPIIMRDVNEAWGNEDSLPIELNLI